MANIFSFAETRNGAFGKVALATATAARKLADSRGGEVHALLVGEQGISAKAAQLGEYGADVVMVCEHQGFVQYNPEATAALAADRIKSGGYRVAIFSTSAQGRDLAPRVAAKLGVSLVTDVTGMELTGAALVVKHPVNIGKIVATVAIAATPAVVPIRPNTFTPVPNPKP